MSSSRSLLREYFEALLIAVIFAVFVRTYTFQAFKIPDGNRWKRTCWSAIT